MASSERFKDKSQAEALLAECRQASQAVLQKNERKEKAEHQSEVIILRVSPEELSRIRKKMLDVGVLNQSAYLRKMALDGYCVRLDLDEVKELNRLLRICSNNLNQYAKRANETGSIYKADIEDLQRRLDAIWQQQKELLTELAGIE